MSDNPLTFPNDENGDVFRRLQANGFDFNVSHSFEFSHVFDNLENAKKMIHEMHLRHPDINTEIYKDEEMSDWDVICTVILVPMYEKITHTEHKLGLIAKECGGYVDGWGVGLNKI